MTLTRRSAEAGPGVRWRVGRVFADRLHCIAGGSIEGEQSRLATRA